MQIKYEDFIKYLDWCENNHCKIEAFFYGHMKDGDEKPHFSIMVEEYYCGDLISEELGYHFTVWLRAEGYKDWKDFEIPHSWVNDVFARQRRKLNREMTRLNEDWDRFIAENTQTNEWVQE